MTNYLLLNQLINMKTPDTEQIVILILHFLIVQKLINLFVPSQPHMEQPTNLASVIYNIRIYISPYLVLLPIEEFFLA